MMKYNLFNIGGNIIKDDEYGIIRENRDFGNICISSYLLYRERSTKIFNYLNYDCIYMFVDGRGIFELNKEILYISYSDIVLAPQNTNHRVINTGDIHLKFLVLKERI